MTLVEPSPRKGEFVSGRWLVIGAFVALLALLLGAMAVVMARREPGSFGGFGINSASREVEVKPKPAPELGVVSLDGEPLRLADFRGRVVILNFWASWCPPCKEEAAALEAAWRAESERGVTFIGINIWDAEADARGFLRQYGVTYPNAIEGGGRLAIEYGVTGIPETFGINAEGVVVKRWVGPLKTASEVTGFIDAIRLPPQAGTQLVAASPQQHNGLALVS